MILSKKTPGNKTLYVKRLTRNGSLQFTPNLEEANNLGRLEFLEALKRL